MDLCKNMAFVKEYGYTKGNKFLCEGLRIDV